VHRLPSTLIFFINVSIRRAFLSFLRLFHLPLTLFLLNFFITFTPSSIRETIAHLISALFSPLFLFFSFCRTLSYIENSRIKGVLTSVQNLDREHTLTPSSLLFLVEMCSCLVRLDVPVQKAFAPDSIGVLPLTAFFSPGIHLIPDTFFFLLHSQYLFHSFCLPSSQRTHHISNVTPIPHASFFCFFSDTKRLR